jgi:mannan endo-1,4-beta-mannosidase
MLDGKQFRFSGSNIYWLGLDENTAVLRGDAFEAAAAAGANFSARSLDAIAYPTNYRIDDAMGTMNEMGATVVRAHTLGASPSLLWCTSHTLIPPCS